MEPQDEVVLSDLSRDGDPGWRAFSDRVMGKGKMKAKSRKQKGKHRRRTFHLSAFIFQLSLWGNGEEYLVHLRTPDTRLPWQLYRAPFVAWPAWETVEVPFDTFRPEQIVQPLSRGVLTRLGVVAYGRRFLADVAVARVALYR